MAKSVLNICRICLQKLEENVQFYFLNNENGLMLQSKLLNFLPEIDLKVTQNPIICKRCTTTIDAIYKFKQLCLRTQSIIKDWVKMQQKPFKDILNYVTKDTVHETIKDELIEDTVIDEPQIVDDDCLQVNTDLPLCIELPTTSLFYCYTCSYHTDSKTNLARHVHSHKNDTVHETFKEELIEDTITDELQSVDDDYLQDNTNLPVCIETSTKPLFYCYTCNYNTDIKRNLARHVHSHRRQLQKIRQFKCDECGYTTPNNYSLTTHKKIHLNTKYIIKASQMQQKLVEDVLSHVTKDTIVDFEDTIIGEQYIVDDSCLQVNTNLPVCIETLTKPLYYCYTCNYNTDTKSNLIQHVHSHRSQLHQRNISDYKCATRYKLTAHMRSDTSNKPYEGKRRFYQLSHTKRSYLTTHMKQHGNIKNYKCTECDFSSLFERNLTKHMIRMHNTEKIAKTYKCGECNYSSEFKPYLNNHVIRMHYSKKKGISYKCDECNYSSMIKQNFKRHVNRMHHREKLAKNYKCDECDYSSVFKGNFMNHVNRMHYREKLAKNYKCDKCDYSSMLKLNLKNHVICMHSTKKLAKTYKCGECDYSSVFKHSLKRHLICMHSTEKLAKNYKCGKCDYSSLLKYNLTRHMIHMHNRENLVKNYKCNVCEYATNNKTALVTHIRLHTGEKPYKCNICDYRSTQNSQLKLHLARHAGIKSFKCELCSYASTQRRLLKHHQQQLLKWPVLDCDKCSYKTLHNFDLKQHQLIHRSKRAYR